MEKRVYFKNLNGLRFFAAFAVILHHLEQYKFWAKIPSNWGNVTVDAFGHKAVSFFFVLSGFLITYLLLEESKKTGTISIKDFYVRRILRIWPVYYLVIILCLFVIPFVFDLSYIGINTFDEKFKVKVVLLFLILPNLLRVYSPSIAGGNQLWSIGVEEQFYIIWPLLVKSFLKRLPRFLIIFISIKFLVTAILLAAAIYTQNLVISAGLQLWILFKVEQMAIGALGAWVLFTNRQKILAFFYHKLTWYASLLGMILLLFFHTTYWLFSYFEAAIFFLVILNVSTNPAVKVSLEKPILNKLGNISYGIYMYHTICITICLYTLTYFEIEKTNLILFNILFYLGSSLLTIAVANVSYKYFEKVFLTLKEKFMIVKSGTENLSNPPLEKVVTKKA
jgi:peptidoglycan/LPS O-acetylase OafA/YrhL